MVATVQSFGLENIFYKGTDYPPKNSNLIIRISLQLSGVNLEYFKRILFGLTEFTI